MPTGVYNRKPGLTRKSRVHGRRRCAFIECDATFTFTRSDKFYCSLNCAARDGMATRLDDIYDGLDYVSSHESADELRAIEDELGIW